MLPRNEVGLGASEMVICIVHSMRSSNSNSSFVQRRPFMNSWMFSSSDSKMDASMLAICGAITCTRQFNSWAAAEVLQIIPTLSNKEVKPNRREVFMNRWSSIGCARCHWPLRLLTSTQIYENCRLFRIWSLGWCRSRNRPRVRWLNLKR